MSTPERLVVVGASAGGVQALQALASALPQDPADAAEPSMPASALR